MFDVNTGMWGTSAPWDDEPSKSRIPVRVQWDYQKEVVVGNEDAGLFDTTWTYSYHSWRPALQWLLSRCPGDEMVVAEGAVPEMVRLAVLVTE